MTTEKMKNKMVDGEKTTIKEASDMTKLSYDYIRKLCISNKIVHIRAGAKILINKQKLSEYLNNGEVNRKVSTI